MIVLVRWSSTEGASDLLTSENDLRGIINWLGHLTVQQVKQGRVVVDPNCLISKG